MCRASFEELGAHVPEGRARVYRRSLVQVVRLCSERVDGFGEDNGDAKAFGDVHDCLLAVGQFFSPGLCGVGRVDAVHDRVRAARFTFE